MNTYRLFKIDGLESACEDYGQAVVYKGSIEHHPDTFVLDQHHVIEAHKMFPVCGNTYRMLSDTRFAGHFDFFGTWDNHFGVFEGCGTVMPFNESSGHDNSDASSDRCC